MDLLTINKTGALGLREIPETNNRPLLHCTELLSPILYGGSCRACSGIQINRFWVSRLLSLNEKDLRAVQTPGSAAMSRCPSIPSGVYRFHKGGC